MERSDKANDRTYIGNVTITLSPDASMKKTGCISSADSSAKILILNLLMRNREIHNSTS